MVKPGGELALLRSLGIRSKAKAFEAIKVLESLKRVAQVCSSADSELRYFRDWTRKGDFAVLFREEWSKSHVLNRCQ